MKHTPLHQGYSLHTKLLLIILIEAVAARFYGIDRLGLWSDELWAVTESSQRTLTEMFEYVRNNESHPPGHYLLLRIIQSLFGNSAFAVRLPSAFFGVATVVLVYHLGCRYFSAEAGLIASALMAGNFQSIFYSQEARANIIVSFFILLSAHILYQIVSGKDRTQGKYIYFWISATLACYLHYAGLVFVLCEGVLVVVIMLWRKESYVSRSLILIKLFAPIVLLQLAWLPGLYHQLTQGPEESWQTVPDAQTLWETLLFLTADDLLRLTVYLTMFVGFLGYVFWTVCRSVSHKNATKLDAGLQDKIFFLLYLIALIVLPVVIFFIKSRLSQPVYNSRHFLYIGPMMLLYIGAIFSFLIHACPGRIHAFLLAGLIGIIIAYQTHYNISTGLYSRDGYKEDYRGAVRVIASDTKFRQQESRVIISTTVFFDHYLNRLLHDQSSDLIFERDDQIAFVRNYLEQRQARQFYYLGATDLTVTNISDPASDWRLIALSNYYHPVCRSKVHRAHVVKFMGPARGVADFATLPLCPYSP